MTDDQHAEHSQNRLQPHHIVIGVCLVVLLIFAILNIDDVRVDFAVDTVDAPLVLRDRDLCAIGVRDRVVRGAPSSTATSSGSVAGPRPARVKARAAR